MANSHHIPTVLTVAGSDSSGGAGIQADLKTFTALGVYGASVITALTAQNTQAVSAVMPVPADFVKRQLDAVLSDLKVDVIKLGMIPNAEICHVVLPFIKDYAVICDPVMISTSGCRLIDEAAISALMNQIIPSSTYITPNFPELEILVGEKVHDLKSAGKELLKRNPRLEGIVLKGGHVDMDSETVTDILIYKSGGRINEKQERHRRYQTRNTHGTGCTFSSAFAAFLAKKYEPAVSFSKAASFVSRLIRLSKGIFVGHGNGPLLHHGIIATNLPHPDER